MKKWAFLISISLSVGVSLSWLLSGCNKNEPIPCSKPAIQIADMSHNYPHCRGLHYEGKDE